MKNHCKISTGNLLQQGLSNNFFIVYWRNKIDPENQAGRSYFYLFTASLTLLVGIDLMLYGSSNSAKSS
jgi:hypothetical protein